MNNRLLLRILCAVLIVATPIWLGLENCRATTIEGLLDNSNGKITVGNLTFTFTKDSVSSDPATPPEGVTFMPPTTKTVDVEKVANGLTLSFNPFLDLKSPQAYTQSIYITYTVTSTKNISKAGLSFKGLAVDIDTKSEVKETFAGQSETLDVYTMKDGQGKVTGQNDQSVDLSNPQMSLMVTDQGILTTPVRGGGAKSTVQLSEITNTFAAPEPASILSSATGFLLVIETSCRNRRRRRVSPFFRASMRRLVMSSTSRLVHLGLLSALWVSPRDSVLVGVRC